MCVWERESRVSCPVALKDISSYTRGINEVRSAESSPIHHRWLKAEVLRLFKSPTSRWSFFVFSHDRFYILTSWKFLFSSRQRLKWRMFSHSHHPEQQQEKKRDGQEGGDDVENTSRSWRDERGHENVTRRWCRRDDKEMNRRRWWVNEGEFMTEIQWRDDGKKPRTISLHQCSSRVQRLICIY